MSNSSLSKRLKYTKAIDLLIRIVKNKQDKSPAGELLSPAAVKQLESAFHDVPGSTWRKHLQ
eukprot:IDg6142t1